MAPLQAEGHLSAAMEGVSRRPSLGARVGHWRWSAPRYPVMAHLVGALGYVIRRRAFPVVGESAQDPLRGRAQAVRLFRSSSLRFLPAAALTAHE